MDQSELDKKYFIDKYVYNCPFCNRNHVEYKVLIGFTFDWSDSKPCYAAFVRCSSCRKISMHLSFEKIYHEAVHQGTSWGFLDDIDLDSKIFYSAPSSFFIIDNRIPRIIRELIDEAEGCLKMNFLTGASACMRKAIYELLILEKIEAESYIDEIKLLKKKYPNLDPELFDILGHIQEMTSDKIHEQSWDKWDSTNLKLIIETLKTVLYDIYVQPKIMASKITEIKKLREKAISKKS